MQSFLNLFLLLLVMAVVIAFILLLVHKLDDLIMPKVQFQEELNKGNLAVGVFLAALVLGVCIMASRAIGAPLDRYDDTFRHQAHMEFGYSPEWTWFKAQGATESGINPELCSGVGACGVMQLMPGTAIAMGVQDRFSARESIRAGIAYDHVIWRGLHTPRPDLERLAVTFSAYNWGPGRIPRAEACARRRSGGDVTFEQLAPCMPAETQGYYPRIARWRARFGPGL